MIGVVLWSDAQDRKAVVWCEDQGDLAFLTDCGAQMQAGGFFDVGDLLRFDLDVRQNHRHARNAQLIEEAVGISAVQEVHRVAAEKRRQASQSAEIIPFRVNSPIAPAAQVRRQATSKP